MVEAEAEIGAGGMALQRTTPVWSAHWSKTAVILAGVLAVLLLAYGETVLTAVAQWRHSSTYSHGFLIAPIALYLVWLERGRLAQETPAPAWAGLAVIAVFALLWLAADVLWIAEGRHFALVGMIEGLLLAVLGWRIFRILLFPFLYLWLMVPTGTFLLPPLQRIAHAGALALIKLTGIPVFAEGTLIQVPEGDFIVEPGCAGLNFILTAVALSLLYGKLNYATVAKRTACVGIAVLTAVAANIARIYLIIVLTQVTHRKLDIADDHLLYGWGFFGVIMLAMMWWGGRFADAPKESALRTPAVALSPQRLGPVAAAALAVALIPAAVSAATAPVPAPATAYELPEAIGPWRKVTADPADWKPATGEGAALRNAAYTWDSWRADVAVAAYGVQGDGREAASGANQPATAPWETMSAARRTLAVNDRAYDVNAAALRAGAQNRSVLSWYQSGDCFTARRLAAKLCAARARLSGRSAPGAFVAISMPRGEGAAAESILAEFTRAFLLTPGTAVSSPAEH